MRAAFTLIELLVVVAIIMILVSILLPSLARAREQARTVKCLACVKQIGNAMVSYFQDEREWFPIEKRNQTPPAGPLYPHYLHGYYYGGHPGDPGWWGYAKLEYRDTPGGRPFNRYLYPGLPTWDVPVDDPLHAAVRRLPVYECPSDTGGFWATSSQEDPVSDSHYRLVGSSYNFNTHFVLNWAIGKYGHEDPPRWLQRANAFLRIQMQRDASRFVTLYEDPFDSALWLHIPRRGWHKQWNRHSFLFLDGHAANIRAETTAGRRRGTGWKTCSGSDPYDRFAWWNYPQDPDYVYRNVSPLPGW